MYIFGLGYGSRHLKGPDAAAPAVAPIATPLALTNSNWETVKPVASDSDIETSKFLLFS